MTQIPDQRRAIEYLGYTKLWEEFCTREIEKFGGDTVLINEDRLRKADRYLRKWIDMTERLLGRHPTIGDGDAIEQQMLKEFFQNIFLLHEQYRIRMTGENGFAQTIIFFSNILESWNSKLNMYAYNSGKFSEAEWQSFYGQTDEWIETIEKAEQIVGKPTKDHDEETSQIEQKNDKTKRTFVFLFQYEKCFFHRHSNRF